MLNFAKETKEQKVSENLNRISSFFTKARNKLYIVFLTISFICLFVIMSFNYRKTNELVRNGVIELSKSSSIQNAEALDLFFLRHEDFLLTTAETLEYELLDKKISPKEIEKLLRSISLSYDEQIYKNYTNADFTGIYASVNGQMIHSYKSDADLPPGYDPTKRPWYREALFGGGKVVFGDPYLDIYSPNMVMTATKLLKDGETVIGMDLTLNDLQFAGGDLDVILSINEKQFVYGYGFILTDKGIVMAHSDQTQQGRSYYNPNNPNYNLFVQIKRCIESENSFFETVINDVKSCVFPHRLSNGWYVVTVIDLDDISNTMSEFSWIVSSGTTLVVLFVLLYCLLITRSHIKNEKLTEELKNALALAKKDGLTGHSNRTAYDMRINELKLKMNTPKDESFAVIMMDLNDLKYVNDHYGHAAGDQYIRSSCLLVRKIFPCEIYRFGGDEFAIFLTDKLFEQREELLQKLKEVVSEGNNLLVPNVEKPSIALGMSVHHAYEEDEMVSILRHADSEMYINKAEIKKARLKIAKS